MSIVYLTYGGIKVRQSYAKLNQLSSCSCKLFTQLDNFVKMSICYCLVYTFLHLSATVTLSGADTLISEQ